MEGGGYFFNSSSPLTPATQAVTAESLPLHIASGVIRTENYWFLSTSR